jgi:ATP-dependent dihydroxyacetone kinase
MRENSKCFVTDSNLQNVTVRGTQSIPLTLTLMSQFINSRDSIVTDAIDGLLASSGGKLARLDGYPHIKVVVRTDWDRSKVALVSGGGSGHEPSHAGLVGRGLLTAAVCGEIFASPSVDAVLAAILAVTGSAGCLLIVKNYTGDRLNFGLAAERARQLGLSVAMVVVADDVALPSIPQPRGLAGTLFVHKIAGALAEEGSTLDAVRQVADHVAGAVRSLGLALTTCTLPGTQSDPEASRIAVGKAELGLGIHGEPGVQQVNFSTAQEAMHHVSEVLKAWLPTNGCQHALLLNNLGGCTPLEMSILAGKLLQGPLGYHASLLIGPAPLMTSCDMRGFSVSLLPCSLPTQQQTWMTALQQPVGPTAWPQATVLEGEGKAVPVIPLPEGVRTALASSIPPSAHPERQACLLQICQTLLEEEASLNGLDALQGDGDTGSTLAAAARHLLSTMGQLPLGEQSHLLAALSAHCSRTMGGSSGVLLAIFFAAAADCPSSSPSSSSSSSDSVSATSGRKEEEEPWEKALARGLDRIMAVGGAKVGDRTLIDALSPAIAALPISIHAAAVAAREGAQSTANMSAAKAGRSAVVPAANLVGNIDPGAEAVARVFESLDACTK